MDLGDANVDEEIKTFIADQKDIVVDRYSDVGCNGDLYFGKHNIFNERVALKFYYVDSKGLSHKEPQILRNIDHPNILKVHDAKMISDNHAYFLTQEINGGDLHKYMKNNVIWTHQVMDIVMDILKGLCEMHKEPNRLLHRDLKPNNILIDKTKFEALIADFGSIKRVPSNKTTIVASKNSLIYRPKETVLKNEYNYQSDVYQVGLILFQLLGGFFPDANADWLKENQKNKANNIKDFFEQATFVEKCFDKLIIGNKLLRYESLPFYINDRLKGIIRKATRPELSRRYKSASEFMNALFKYKNNSIDWCEFENETLAKKKNNTYRIAKGKKGLKIEKKVNNGNYRQIKTKENTLEKLYELIVND